MYLAPEEALIGISQVHSTIVLYVLTVQQLPYYCTCTWLALIATMQDDAATLPPPVREGWLLKRSTGMFCRLQRRYFVLRDDALMYFAGELDVKPRRLILVRLARTRA